MGLTNPDALTLNSGLQLSNTYMTFVPGANVIRSNQHRLSFSWTMDPDGTTNYFANGKLFTYLSKASKTAGSDAIHNEHVSIPADSSAAEVFSVFYSALQVQYPNGVIDAD